MFMGPQGREPMAGDSMFELPCEHDIFGLPHVNILKCCTNVPLDSKMN